MALVFCVLFSVSIASSMDINLNEIKVKSAHNSRSLLQSTITSIEVANAETMTCVQNTKQGVYGTSPVYYEFILTERKEVQFDNCGTTFDPNLYVFNSTYDWISESACGGDDCGDCTSGTREQFTIELNPATYYIELYPCCSPGDQTADDQTYYVTVTCLTASPTDQPSQFGDTRSPTPDPTKAPTQQSGDLSACDSSELIISIPETQTIDLWFTINSVAAQAVVGIDACDYGDGYNDFSFYLQLYTNPDAIYYSGASSSNNPRRCAYNGDGAYLEFTRSTFINYANYWLKVTIYSDSRTDRYLKLMRYCEIKPTTPLPTPMPTTPAPISARDVIRCDDEVSDVMHTEPHYYQLNLPNPTKINIQNCQSEFDTELWVYEVVGMTELNDVYGGCDGDDCGNCTSGTREEYTLTLNAGEYYVMIRAHSDNGANGEMYYIVTRCQDATGTPTTPGPTTPQPTNNPTTFAPSRSPLFAGETHAPTTRIPTRSPVTARPSVSPLTNVPTSATTTPTRPGTQGSVAGSVHAYCVVWAVVVMVVASLFV